jgi:hypothetical protein
VEWERVLRGNARIQGRLLPLGEGPQRVASQQLKLERRQRVNAC